MNLSIRAPVKLETANLLPSSISEQIKVLQAIQGDGAAGLEGGVHYPQAAHRLAGLSQTGLSVSREALSFGKIMAEILGASSTSCPL